MEPVNPKLETGQHVALNTEVKKWGLIPAVVAGLSAVLGTGGIIVFLVGYASTVEAKAVVAAQAVAAVQSQRGDVLAAEQRAQKERLEAIDAGVARRLDELEKKVEAANRRSEQRADQQEAMLREVLREVRKK